MNSVVASNAFLIAASIVFLVWFFYGPWNRFIIDLSRQNLFEIRDEIFLLAADGKLSFDAEVYKLVRVRLNGFIRYCHHLTLFGLYFASSSEHNVPRNQNMPDVLKLIREIPDRDAARIIERKYAQAVLTMVAAMVFRSTFLTLLLMITLPVSVISELLKGTSSPIRLYQFLQRAVEREVVLESFDPSKKIMT